MKYLIKDTDNLQKMNDLFSQIKESIAQLQEMVAEFEQELELVVRNRKSGKDKYSILSRSADKVITGVRQFAEYIHKSPATAQKILNSNVLQEYGIAYRVGNTWNINIESLDRLITENPQILSVNRIRESYSKRILNDSDEL